MFMNKIVNNINERKAANLQKYLQEVFHIYLNKFEIAVSNLFLSIFSNNKFTSDLQESSDLG